MRAGRSGVEGWEAQRYLSTFFPNKTNSFNSYLPFFRVFPKSEVQIGILQNEVSVHCETKNGALHLESEHIGVPKLSLCYPTTSPDSYQLGSFWEFLLRSFSVAILSLAAVCISLIPFITGTCKQWQHHHNINWLLDPKNFAHLRQTHCSEVRKQTCVDNPSSVMRPSSKRSFQCLAARHFAQNPDSI